MEAVMEERTFPGTLDSLEPVRRFVISAANKYGLEHRAAYKLCLAVDEIATNIVTHGYQEAGLSGDITVGAEREGNTLVIRLEDRGRSYDPSLHVVPQPEQLAIALEARYPGGLGILLAQMGVDELQYSTTADGNVHRFIVTTPVQAYQSGDRCIHSPD